MNRLQFAAIIQKINLKNRRTIDTMIPFEFMMDSIRKIHANDRLFTYDSMLKTCSIVEDIMRKMGMSDVKTLHFPSDGRIDHGGWIMPMAWNARCGILETILPDGSKKQICSYEETPCSLMLYSYSADVTAEMVIATPDADMQGKIVLVQDEFPSCARIHSYFKRGAVSVLGGWLPGEYAGKPGYEFLDDSCQWYNYALPFWPEEEHHFGFSLTPNQSEYLRQLLKENGSVKLHARVDTEMKEGTMPMVTGLLPGETDEEIVLTGHLFEQGADDNASGCAMSLGIVKEIIAEGKKLKRGIRLLFTQEIKSLQAYLNSNPKLPRLTAGLDIDMVGVSLDGEAHIGDSAPVFPTYAPCLLKYLVELYGFSGIVRGFNTMDTQFSDSEYQVPMTYLDLFGVPDYHKSSDTPETISRQVMETSYNISFHYTTFLANAGLEEAKKLVDIVYEFSRTRIGWFKEHNPCVSTGYPTPAFAAAIAKARQESILPLVEPEKRDEFKNSLAPIFQKINLLCEFEDTIERRTLTEKQRSELEKLVYKKTFHGFLSFEKYMMWPEKFPDVSHFLQGWSVPPWVDYALMWADGRRNAVEIWTRLRDSGHDVDADQLYALLQFLNREGYIHFLAWEEYTGNTIPLIYKREAKND